MTVNSERIMWLRPSGDPLALAHNFPILWSTMIAPNDDGVRLALEAEASLLALARSVEDGTKMIEVSGDLVCALANREAVYKLANGYEKQAARRGQIAGIVLMNFYILSLDSELEASVNRAVHVAMKQAVIRGSWSDGSPMPKERNSTLACWTDFKSAAHLWAARAIVDSVHGLVPPIKFDHPRDVIEVLQWAEALRLWAEGFRQRRTRTAVASVGELWRPQPTAAIQPVDLPRGPSPIPPGIANWLLDYRAPTGKFWN